MTVIQQAPQPTIEYDAYVALALEDPDRQLELYRGRVREKPGMSMEHGRCQDRLVGQLHLHLIGKFGDKFEVRYNSARLRAPGGAIFIPDVAVVSAASADALTGPARRLETYEGPMPFVAEIWSPSTGDHDVDTKVPEHRARGDAEIWRVHPYDRTVTVWRRQADGSYEESRHTSGMLTLWALPEVTIDLDALLR